MYGMEIFEIALQTLYILSLGGYLAGPNPLTKTRAQITVTTLVVGVLTLSVGFGFGAESEVSRTDDGSFPACVFPKERACGAL